MFSFQDGMDYNKPRPRSGGKKKTVVLIFSGVFLILVVLLGVLYVQKRSDEPAISSDKADRNTPAASTKGRTSVADLFIDSLESVDIGSIIGSSSIAVSSEEAGQLAAYYNQELNLKNCKAQGDIRASLGGVKQESYSCPVATGGSDERILVITYEDEKIVFVEITYPDKSPYGPDFIEKLGDL